MIARPTVVLPQPDSPTRPSVSPRCSWNEIRFTASTSPTRRSSTPPKTGNLTTRSWTSRRISVIDGDASPVGLAWFRHRRGPAVRIEVTAHPVARRVFNQRRLDVGTRFERIRAARDQPAADRQEVKVQHPTLEYRPAPRLP